MRKEAHGRTCSVAAENPRVKPVDNFTGVGLGNLKKRGRTRLYKLYNSNSPASSTPATAYLALGWVSIIHGNELLTGH